MALQIPTDAIHLSSLNMYALFWEGNICLLLYYYYYLCIYSIGSLPREWFQEIKHMMAVHSTLGLLLTCTQGSRLYLHMYS
jgi:hypothetical protein